MKKICRLLLIPIIILMMCQDVNGETIYTEDALKYVIRDNEIVIVKYFGLEEEVTIPRTINNIPVTMIAAGAFVDTAAVTVIIPDSIAYIEEGAFSSDTSYISENDIEYDPVEPHNPNKPEEGEHIIENGEEVADIASNEIEESGEIGDVDVDGNVIVNNKPQSQTDDHRISEEIYSAKASNVSYIIYIAVGAIVIIAFIYINKKFKNDRN